MKKLLLLLATVGMIFTACEGSDGVEEDNGGTPFVPEITISPKDLTFGCNGGEQAVDITANFEYEVAERASWITVEQTNEGLLVIVDANKNTSERSAFISITNSQYDINKTVEVWQEGFVPKIELAQQSIEVEFEPAEYEVAVTSPYSWEATTKNDWIVVESETGIAGEEKLKFTTLRNEEEQERKGTITLKNTDYNLVAELYVTQKAFVPAITIEPELLVFTFEGGTQEVAVTANFDEYEFSSRADWLTIEKSEKGLKVTASNHTEVEERTAEITISNEKYGISKIVNVTQGAFVSAITIEPESLLFTFEGGTQEVAITANFEDYEYSTNADWLTVEKSENGISVTVPNYVEVEERTAEITISKEKYGVSKVVNITQGAFVPAITIEPETLTFAVEGGTQEVAITVNFEYEYSTNADWLTIEKSEKGVNITATPNTKFEERTTEITISSEKYGISKAITIMQQGVSAESKNVIIYTSSNGKIVTPHSSNVFGANIVSNTYENGQGVIIFDAPVTSIGDSAFNSCSSLTRVTIGNGVTSIGDYAFYECTSLTSVIIPDSVTSIGKSEFSRCTLLTSVTIPNSVTKIGDSAFSKCTSLTSVTIPNSVTWIGDYAFCECTSLTSVTIPDSVTWIGDYAFYNCSSLTAFYGKFASADNRCLIVDGVLNSFASAGLTEYTIPDSVTSIGGSTFYQCSSLTSVTIGNGVTKIGGQAFSGCTSLTSITIPDSVTSIGNSAFYGCTSLKSVTIGKGVTSIGGRAFYNCTGELIINSKIVETDYTYNNYPANSNNGWLYNAKFTKVTIGNSVTSIGWYAFRFCTSLTSITIPDSVTSIGNSAFYGCASLTSVYCKPTTPPTGGNYMFSDNASGRKIYVPIGSGAAYKAKSYWSEYADSIEEKEF